MVAPPNVWRHEVGGNLGNFPQRHAHVGGRAYGIEVRNVVDPRALVGPQAEHNRDQAVFLSQVRGGRAGETRLQQQGDVLVGNARYIGPVGVDRHAHLQHFRLPVVVDVVGSRNLSKLVFHVLSDAAQRRDTIAEQPDLNGDPDRRPGFQLLDVDAGRRQVRRQFHLQPIHEAFGHAAIDGMDEDLGIIVRPLFRNNGQPEPRTALSDEGGVTTDLVARKAFDLLNDAQGFFLRLPDGRAFRQVDINGKDAMQVLGKESRTDGPQGEDPADQQQDRHTQRDRLVVERPSRETSVRAGQRGPDPLAFGARLKSFLPAQHIIAEQRHERHRHDATGNERGGDHDRQRIDEVAASCL